MPIKLVSLYRLAIQWLLGSLILRGFIAGMNWVVELSRGSFIVGLFAANDTPQQENIRRSIFVRLADKILNGIPKPIRMPARWPCALSNLSTGSSLIRNFTDRLDTPVPPPVPNTNAGMVILWGLYALPIWALLVVIIGLPVLPTMVLAGMLVPAFIFALFSRRFVLDGTAVFLLLFIVISVAAALMSVAPATSLPVAAISIAFMLSTILIVACAKTRHSVNMLITGFVIAAAITGLVGMYQVFTGYRTHGAWLDMILFVDIGLRLPSTFGNPNVFGTYLLLAIPVTAGCVVYAKKLVLKLAALGITGLLLANLLATYSRGCYVSLAIGALAFVLIIRKELVVAFIPALLGVLLILPTTVVARIASIANFEDTSTAYRLNIWRGSLRMLADFWPAGVGQGEYAFNMVYTYYSLGAIVTPHSHNLFMQIFIETGIVGFLVFIGVLACFFRAHANFVRRTKELRLKVFSASFVAAAVGFLAQGMFDYNFYNYSVRLAFFMFMGIGIAFTRVAADGDSQIQEETEPRESEWVKGYHD